MIFGTLLIALCVAVSLTDASITTCEGIDCEFNPCVNMIRNNGDCCPVCPNGPNCYAMGRVIRGDKETIIGEWKYRCPTSNEPGYEELGGICSKMAVNLH
ncbi:hypothetical protein SNE40_023011 [Patella caerulea]